jgi:glucose-6-phosphate 1-dehydrogenase
MQTLPTFDLVLFGGTGDLAMRKLLPALYRRTCTGQVCTDARIIGAARSELSREEYLAQVRSSCMAHLEEFDEQTWERFAQRVDYC